MKASTQRAAIRWLHIIASIPIAGYIYGPVAQMPRAAFVVKAVIVPLVVLSGLWLWKGHLLRKFLSGRTPASRGTANLVALLALCVTAPLVPHAASANDWSQWRGPSRNGVTSEEVSFTTWPASGPPRVWSANIGKSYAAVSVQGQRLYAIGSQAGKETVTCFDALSGDVRWRHPWPHPKREDSYDPNPTASTGTPIVSGDRVYVLTREGLALCLNADDGQPLWQRDLIRETKGALPPFGAGSSPVVEQNLVLYNLGKQGIALDKHTGAVVWNSGAGLPGHASPVVYQAGGQERVAFFTGNGLVGVELQTGRQLWRHPSSSPNNLYALDPIVAGENLFITGYGRAQQLRVSGDAPTLAYEVRNLRSTFVNPVLVDGSLYGSDRGNLQCIDWATGAEKWVQAGVLRRSDQDAAGETRPPMSEGALIAAGKHLLALDDGGTLRLIAASPKGYHEVASARVLKGLCWTAPVLANGQLYCRNNNGDLVCVDLRGAKQ